MIANWARTNIEVLLIHSFKKNPCLAAKNIFKKNMLSEFCNDVFVKPTLLQ